MKCSKEAASSPEKPVSVKTALDEVVRIGAQKMLMHALEAEVEEFIAGHMQERTKDGRRTVVRNGYLPIRNLLTGVGPIAVRQPRIDDRRLRNKDRQPIFISTLLPRYMRRIPSLDNLIPALYLKGISTGDFPAALAAILGESADNLSASTVMRLKARWEQEYGIWAKRDLSNKKYVYFWVDGIYFNVRLEGERSCVLVIIGADEDGNKELVALSDGMRESTLSWKDVLLDVKQRGLIIGPNLAIGDGALGFWAAIEEIYPQARQQRCWVHKTANILDKVPKSVQPKMKASIHEMYMAETKEDALLAYGRFVGVYDDKYPKAVACLTKDKDQLFTFYDFPAAQWIHIRTTNVIESTFATVRHRTRRTKGCGSRTATLTMAWKLVQEAQRTWKRLKGHDLIQHVIKCVPFVNGIMQKAA
jgi:transposase-like protein